MEQLRALQGHCLQSSFPPDHWEHLPPEFKDPIFQDSICETHDQALTIPISPLQPPSFGNEPPLVLVWEHSRSLFSLWPHHSILDTQKALLALKHPAKNYIKHTPATQDNKQTKGCFFPLAFQLCQ